jgi:hypothetical protein
VRGGGRVVPNTAYRGQNKHEKLKVASCCRYSVCSDFSTVIPHTSKQGSSVSIVSGYELDDRAIEVRSPAEAKGFFL